MNESPGFIGRTVLPKPEGNFGSLTKAAVAVREALISWADDIPIVNLAGKAIRAIL